MGKTRRKFSVKRLGLVVSVPLIILSVTLIGRWLVLTFLLYIKALGVTSSTSFINYFFVGLIAIGSATGLVLVGCTLYVFLFPEEPRK